MSSSVSAMFALKTIAVRSCASVVRPQLHRAMASGASNSLVFRQLVDDESKTYTYLLADEKSKEAVLIDPVIEQADRDVKLLKELGLKLKFTAETHCHADHITGAGKLKHCCPNAKTLIAGASNAVSDLKIKHGDTIKFGDFELEVRSTPGHTNGCVTYVLHSDKLVFTGDAVLIRGCGRTDFQEGSPDVLYNSIYSQIFSLGDDYKIYPGHDYRGFTMSTVKEEKEHNPRLTKNKEEFKNIMDNLNLAYPKKIDASLPANKEGGLKNLPDHLKF